MISAELGYKKRFVEVNGKRIAYLDEGRGDSIVFLHGNPTSSYLWRNVIPELTGLGRCIAPDLIGQGDSDKLPPSEGPDRYGFHAAYAYLDAFLRSLDLSETLTLVVHDWGSALGFHWAKQHPERVNGIAYMEALVMPVTWNDWPEAARGVFKGFRSAKGEDLVLDRNTFVERVLPGSVIRQLTSAEMEHYRAPFPTPEDRRPTLNWPRQIPIEGEPADVTEVVEAYGTWLATHESPPKLFVNAEPGSILTGRQRDFCRSWPNQTEVTVKGLHFVQEDSPVEIGRAIAHWMRQTLRP